MEGLARVVAAEGKLAWAVQVWGAAAVLREVTDVTILPFEHADYECSIVATRFQMGEEAFAAAWMQGYAMTPGQALATQGST